MRQTSTQPAKDGKSQQAHPGQNVLNLSEHVRRRALETELGIKYEELARLASQLKASGMTFEEACSIFNIETEHNPIDDLFADASLLGMRGGRKALAHTDRALQPLLLEAANRARGIYHLPPVRRTQH